MTGPEPIDAFVSREISHFGRGTTNLAPRKTRPTFSTTVPPMKFTAILVPVQEILPWREHYRQEMNCQVIHDSLHSRAGWTESYLLKIGSSPIGYGAVAVGGPWQGTKTVFEFYLLPERHRQAFDIFEAFSTTAKITAFEVQTNDVLLTILLHARCSRATSEKIIFRDALVSTLPANGAVFRRSSPEDSARIFIHHTEPVGDWLLELNGEIAATGGILYHYNQPYADLYMEVSAPFRRRGLGCYLVQELKRVCREGGSVPCARCSPSNFASLKTIQKAGFAPCAHILVGSSKG